MIWISGVGIKCSTTVVLLKDTNILNAVINAKQTVILDK